MTYFEEMCADGMFETLGYEKVEENVYCRKRQFNYDEITFEPVSETISCALTDGVLHIPMDISVKELQAINKKCVELCWIKERD